MNQPIANLDAFKARQKATWEAGDFGEVAKHIESAAEEFMGSLALRPGLRLLDAACGTGNLAIHAARAGCAASRIGHPGVSSEKMFEVFSRHLPPPPAGLPSTMLWGDEPTVRERLHAFTEVQCTRRIARMSYPFPPAETVEFFRQYYGPTLKAFAMLDEPHQQALHADLVTLQTQHNTASHPHHTEALAEYLEVIATRGR